MTSIRRFGRVLVLALKRFFRGPDPSLPARPHPKGLLGDEARRAQSIARETQRPITDTLIELGMLRPRELMQARAHELGMAYVDMDRVRLDDDVRFQLPKEFLIANQVVPLKRDGKNLWLATSNPGDVAAFEEAKMLSGCRVIPVMALGDGIEKTLADWFGLREPK